MAGLIGPLLQQAVSAYGAYQGGQRAAKSEEQQRQQQALLQAITLARLQREEADSQSLRDHRDWQETQGRTPAAPFDLTTDPAFLRTKAEIDYRNAHPYPVPRGAGEGSPRNSKDQVLYGNVNTQIDNLRGQLPVEQKAVQPLYANISTPADSAANRAATARVEATQRRLAELTHTADSLLNVQLGQPAPIAGGAAPSTDVGPFQGAYRSSNGQPGPVHLTNEMSAADPVAPAPEAVPAPIPGVSPLAGAMVGAGRAGALRRPPSGPAPYRFTGTPEGPAGAAPPTPADTTTGREPTEDERAVFTRLKAQYGGDLARVRAEMERMGYRFTD